MPKQSLGYWLRLSFAIDTVLDFIYDHLSQTTSGPESDPQRGVVNSHLSHATCVPLNTPRKPKTMLKRD